jgi:hypothetical protein
MGAIDVNSDPPPPFKLRTRKVGWWPDAGDWSKQDSRDRLFQEESFGIKNTGVYEPFPIQIKPNDEESKKWILGKKLAKHTDLHVDTNFTLFVRRLARRARQYNASLYRLRRLRFWLKYQQLVNTPGKINWPDNTDQWGNSPWGNNPGKPDPSNTNINDPKSFPNMACTAEGDWQKVTDDFHQYLSDIREHGCSKMLEPKDPLFSFRLKAFDVVTVNGYIMSMRVVVGDPGGGDLRSKELGGSSSHVSLSSAFSSYLPPQQ